MRPLALLFCVALFATTSTMQAQELCPCVPVSHEWIATACDTWNCAVSAITQANGDRHVMPLPTTSGDYTWVVLKRVAAGSVIVSPDNPFKVDGFGTMGEALAHYYTIDTMLRPMLVTAADGRVLVIARNAVESPVRRRAVH